VVLAVVQSFGIASALQTQGVAYDQGIGFVLTAVVALTTGTMFLMWLGEQITERGVGNGVSLIIFAGIVSGLPSAALNTMTQVSSGEISILAILAIIVLVLGVTYFVVYMERGLRKITVNYARRQGGRQGYMNQNSHLPLKLNMSGVIPPIFASSLILFPSTISTWLSSASSTAEGWRGALSRGLQGVAQALAPAEPLHMALYGAMIMGFAFFYTALVFNSQETAENLKKSGALIPGIRPGKATGDYIDGVMTRLTLIGSIYLVLVCLLPEVLRASLNVPFYFGGTSLLIVVVVVMDFTAQIQAHMMSSQYEGLMKKANLKGGSRGLTRG
jgi:preprotein translocase subunit SecY